MTKLQHARGTARTPHDEAMAGVLTRPRTDAKPAAAFARAAAGEWAATDRARLLKLAVASGCACGFALSRRLWLSSVRDYPHAPVAEVLSPPAYPLDFAWLAALFVLLALVVASTKPRKYLAAFLVMAGLLALFDQSRWQPWFYQYYFMLAALALFPWRGAARFDARRDTNAERDGAKLDDDGEPVDAAGVGYAGRFDAGRNVDARRVEARRAAALDVKRAAALDACRLIVAGTYFWGGVHKLNPGFEGTMLLLLGRLLPQDAAGALAAASAFAVPAVEIFVGVALLTRRFRRIGVALALSTHAVVLLLLVPSGTNTVVWPWNLASAAAVVILFWRARDFSARSVLAGLRRPLNLAVAVLFCLMPALGVLGLWDSYLSAALYTGGTKEAVVRFGEPVFQRLPARAQRAATREGDRYILGVRRWSFAELNVPAYPEERIFRRVARDLCGLETAPGDVTLEIRRRPRWRGDAGSTETLDCAALTR